MCCRPAVERAFTELTARGVPENHAIEAALFIYRFHHPDIPACTAAADVMCWTLGGTRH